MSNPYDPHFTQSCRSIAIDSAKLGQMAGMKKAPGLTPAAFFDYGEGGIRTHGKLPYTAFPVLRLRPLGHFSITRVVRILTLN
jgi:hypothetical protein